MWQGKLETPNILSNIPFIQAFDAMITVDKCILQDELAMNQLKVIDNHFNTYSLLFFGDYFSYTSLLFLLV
jgi:hypothetical protein